MVEGVQQRPVLVGTFFKRYKQVKQGGVALQREKRSRDFTGAASRSILVKIDRVSKCASK